MDQQAEKDMTERVTGLGRRTREEIEKWNQMTALRFQTGGRHQTSLASLRGDQSTNSVVNVPNVHFKALDYLVLYVLNCGVDHQ